MFFTLVKQIRGKAGVEWAGSWLAERENLMSELSTPEALGGLLHEFRDAYLQETADKHANDPAWACHRQKRLARLSGGHWINALMWEATRKQLMLVGKELAPLFAAIRAGMPLSEAVLTKAGDQLLKIKLPLTYEARKPVRWGKYTVMDNVRVLCVLAVHSNGSPDAAPPLTPTLFAYVSKMQSERARAPDDEITYSMHQEWVGGLGWWGCGDVRALRVSAVL